MSHISLPVRVAPGGRAAGSPGHGRGVRQRRRPDAVSDGRGHGVVLGRRGLRQAGPRGQRRLQGAHEGRRYKIRNDCETVAQLLRSLTRRLIGDLMTFPD